MISLPKVIDFGTSCYEGSSQSRAPDYVQTRYYRAPEVKLDNNHLDGNPDCAGDDGCGVHWGGRHVEPRLHRGRASHWQTYLSWGGGGRPAGADHGGGDFDCDGDGDW